MKKLLQQIIDKMERIEKSADDGWDAWTQLKDYLTKLLKKL
jgi:hypothetical protein